MKLFKLPTRWIVLFAISLSFAGCATVQHEAAPSGPDRPQKGKALVIFYREKHLQGWAVITRRREVIASRLRRSRPRAEPSTS